MKNTPERVKQLLVNNCINLNRLYGLDSGLHLILREDIAIYGLITIGKTFWSKHPHNYVSSICLYRSSITIAFLGDLSKQLLSIINKD